MWGVITSTVGLFLSWVSQYRFSHCSGRHATGNGSLRPPHNSCLISQLETKHAIGEYLAYKECVVLMRTQNNGPTLENINRIVGVKWASPDPCYFDTQRYRKGRVRTKGEYTTIFHLFLSEADSLPMWMLISGCLVDACVGETHSTARVNLCSKLA